MKILFLDVETNSLDPKTGRVLEIGASLYCTEESRTLRSICFLTSDDTIKVPEETTAINGISQSMLDKEGVDFKSVLPLLTHNFVEKCDYLCAHNAPFDRAFVEAELERFGYPKWTKPWIDTSTDLPLPGNISSRRLICMAAEHGFVNPFPHTALSDVLTMQKVFGYYPFEGILNRYKSPSILISALVDYANRDKASKKGFRWNAEKKRWQKMIKEFELEAEKASYDFEVQVHDQTK